MLAEKVVVCITRGLQCRERVFGVIIIYRENALGRLATEAVSKLDHSGPKPVRILSAQLRRAIITGASYFGLKTWQQVDEWMLEQMRAADQLIARAEETLKRLRDAPETQQLALKIPPWMPFSRFICKQLRSNDDFQISCVHGSPNKSFRTIVKYQNTTKATRAAAPKAPTTPPSTPRGDCVSIARSSPLGQRQATSFSRRALATERRLTLRTFDDETLAELHPSPIKAFSTKGFSRRALATDSSALDEQSLDEETASLLVMPPLPPRPAVVALSPSSPAMNPTFSSDPVVDLLNFLIDANPYANPQTLRQDYVVQTSLPTDVVVM